MMSAVNAVLRGLIFDMDGTLADTLPLCIAAFQRAVGRHAGREPDEAAVRALFGSTEQGMLVRMVGAEHAAAAHASYLEEYRRLHRAGPPLFAGLETVLAEAAWAGVRLGIVSGKGAESLAIAVDALGVAHHFTDVQSGSTEGCVKAERIRALLARWSLPPHNVAYVGDVASDVTAARAAGVIAVAAAWSPGTDPEALARQRPDALFGDVAAFAAWARAAFGSGGDVTAPAGTPRRR